MKRTVNERRKKPWERPSSLISGIHGLIYARDPKRVRAFFRDVLNFPYIDAHDGWLIFALPPAELGIHPSTRKNNNVHELYLLCEDVETTFERLRRKGVRFTGPIEDVGYGYATTMKIPGGGKLGLYQPKHKLAIRLKRAQAER